MYKETIKALEDLKSDLQGLIKEAQAMIKEAQDNIATQQEVKEKADLTYDAAIAKAASVLTKKHEEANASIQNSLVKIELQSDRIPDLEQRIEEVDTLIESTKEVAK